VGLLLLSLTTALASTLPRLGLYLDQLGMPRIPSLLDLFNQHLLSPIVSYATFTLFYKFLPAARVSWRPALWGSLLTVLLWEGARLLFSRFLALSYGFGLLSGSLAAIIGFLLWTYTGMAILLLGAELASILNGRDRTTESNAVAFTPSGVS
jgi:membrane protein